MDINYNSFYYNTSKWALANKTVKWLTMDTEELYKKNLINNYDKLKKYDWIDKEFTYTFNSLGFRCDEFSNDPSILFLGDSHTVGIGLPLENVWATIVAKKLNLKSINLGQGGGSSNTLFRLGSYWIPKILPKIVVYHEPNMWRLELLNNNKIEFLSPTGDDKYMERLNILEFYKLWISDDTNGFLNQEKNRLSIEHICYLNGCKFIYIERGNGVEYVDYARDLAHSGVESNLKFSNMVLDLINGTTSRD